MDVIESCLIWGEGPAGGACLGAVTIRRPGPSPLLSQREEMAPTGGAAAVPEDLPGGGRPPSR